MEVWEHEKNSAAFTRSPKVSNNQSCEGIAEEIATTVDNKQQELDLRLDHDEPLKENDEGESSTHPSGDPKQHKQSGRWVDPTKANEPNSWMF